jgi:hypothetical protein
MKALVSAELLKLRSTQVWFWLLLAVVVLGGGIVIGNFASSDGVRDAKDVADAIANANIACVAPFILGALAVTTEYRYQTITPTLLATPSRWRVVGAKIMTYALVGLGYAIVCLGVQLAIALPWASAKGVDVSLGDADMRRVLLGMIAVLVLMALVGVGVGAMIKNQVVTIVLSLVFLFVLQNILAAIPHVKDAWRFTPSGAISKILFTGNDTSINNAPQLDRPLSYLVLALWAAIPAAIGAGLTMRRDIT